MKCPKCGGKQITAMRERFSPMDVQNYRMGCKGCGHSWRKSRGLRMHPSASSRAQWEGVEYVLSRFEQEEADRCEKAKRGECPDCGGKLTTVADEERSDRRLVAYSVTCDGCDYSSHGCADREWWEKKHGNV